MKKLLVTVISTLIIALALIYSTKDATAEEIIEMEKKACFDFFWNETVSEEGSASYGLTVDRYPNNPNMASIASSGFMLASLPIGVESGYITYEEGYERALLSLQSLNALPTVYGFYYHFWDIDTTTPSANTEVSSIDTALLVAGALTAGAYFGDEVMNEAYEIYYEVQWPWFYDESVNQFYMAYKPTDGFSGHWDFYAEQLIIYFLAAGSPTYPVGKEAYDGFTKHVGTYGDYTFIHSWFGSMFTYQFSHAFLDFSHYEDESGINWYENSVNATYAQYQYAIDNPNNSATLHELSWGITASDGPNGYNGLYGTPPSGFDNLPSEDDGTVAPNAAIAALPFAPEIVLPTIEYFYNEADLFIQPYGFVDSYNVDEDYVAEDVIGIDKGITLLMIENYQTGLIWELFMSIPEIQTAFDVLGFTYI